MTPAVSVSRYSLTVDARETVQAVLDAVLDEADAARGAPLGEALRLAAVRDGAVFAAGAFRKPTRDDFRPGPSDPEDLPEVSAPGVVGVLRTLEKQGLASVHDLWSETSDQAYLDEGRTLVAVHVEHPFFLAGVWYGRSRPHAVGYADRWEIDERTDLVGAGWYVVGLVGDFTSDLVGVAAVAGDADPETLTCRVYGVEGFDASSCLAYCDTCGAQWRAEGASWRFRAYHRADDFDFDDADDFDDDTIACPACGTGRVGFSVG